MVDPVLKKKSLSKFGRTTNADSGVATTVASFQGTVANETFVTTNLIDEVVCDQADTQTLVIEGHTIDGSGNLTFVVQEATLTGTAPVALSTPLARCTRMYVKAGTFASPASDLTGNVYAYDNTDGQAGGTPTTAAATKCMIVAGQNQSEKCATSISSTDYWFITGLQASCEKGNSATVTVDLEIEVRTIGGVWRPTGQEISLRTGAQSSVFIQFLPYIVVPKNSDVRLVATSNTNDTAVAGRISGFLAKVVA
ncbi:MAG: hypothetical protein VW405_08730 [Rhodospirillaceae bacterium]